MSADVLERPRGTPARVDVGEPTNHGSERADLATADVQSITHLGISSAAGKSLKVVGVAIMKGMVIACLPAGSS